MQNPSILSHVSVGVSDVARAAHFYDAVLATLGARRLIEHNEAIAYGREYPEFWINIPYDNKPPGVGNGAHFAFFAHSKAEVDAFHTAAMAAGACDDGAPGPRPEYGAPFYGCYVRDLDGNKIEATFWDLALADASAT